MILLVLVPSVHAEKIVIGSKNFTENRFLAEVTAQLIEARTDIEVDRRLGLGGTTVVFTALQSGELDLYPEYTGTAWVVHLGIEEQESDPLRVYLRCAREFKERFDLVWVEPFGFENSYALAVRRDFGERFGLKRISDLLGHEDDISAGVSHEFLARGDGFPGLAKSYGLTLDNVRGMQHELSYQAIEQGTIDLIDTYTTDGKLLRYDLTLLEDDLGFFPPYDAASIVRAETLERHPELRSLLSELAFTIDDDRMRQFNARIEDLGGAFEQVAREFLVEEGLIGAPSSTESDTTSNSSFWKEGRLSELLGLIGEHLLLTLAAVLLAILVAVPLGLLLTRHERLAALAMNFAGVLQTIPSLALLAFLISIPWLGLGVRSAIVALFLYALLPILRNTYTGIKNVDPDLLEAADGIGLTDRQRLTRVELPLSVSTIMAGVRTSTVISIGVATLAAFIGAGGLGEPILTGLQLNSPPLILFGAIPSALLALLADFLLGRIELALAPRHLKS
jgi:osmoprotectant transport system permease protein